ncbi:right-handed parallel beta-helix repeat-containing protein [Paraliomyxa miuraensis]|uniref:right-handed parallel beta-helix repeat-containing protein n=1 Tax=Paraliomyxa miuraensis TaxID=376150 RepID=UPI0022564D33|nr:right-handed parallel beta-helix repeat-containing protein [Paraliomyxa miuraensis]MCX4247890.1 hypothetical protein [Paraliomyxa miuraensis]
MTLALRRPRHPLAHPICARGLALGLGGGALVLSACFDPGVPVDTELAEGSGTTSQEQTATSPGTETSTTATTPTTGPDTDDPPTTDPDTTAGPADCEGDGPDPACDAATPYCVDGTCVDCTGLPDGACMALDPTAPVCDAEVGVCSGCTEHEQCSTGACRYTTGECFAQSNRLWVDNTFGGCAGGTGSEANPFCTVVEAMEVLNGQAGSEPWAIFVAGSPNPYEGTVDPDNNRPVAIIGPSAGLAATLDGVAGFTIDHWAQSPETYLARLTIDRGFSGTAIRCNTGQVFATDTNFVGGDTAADVTGCSLRLRRSVVSTGGLGVMVTGAGELLTDQTTFENSSGGIVIDGGSAVLRRSVVRNHYVAGGIEVINGGELQLVNSMVYYNQYNNDGVHVANGGTVDVVHSTIIGTFSCGGMAGPTSIRNSIVLHQPFEAGLDCTSTSVHTSVVNTGLGQGMGNVQADAMDLGTIFVNPVTGMDADWHVLPGSIPEGVAVHQPGDPVVDFDGEPRPEMAGANDYAGADVP